MMQPAGEVRKAQVASDGVVTGALGGAGVPSRRVAEFGLIWQPPLGILDEDILPGGRYELILTPESVANFKKFCVEQTGALGVQKVPGAAGDYDVSVEEIYYYVCTSEAARMDKGSYYVDLSGIKCSLGSQTVRPGTTTQQQFDVSPSTDALTVAFQDSRAGFDTRISRTKFVSYTNQSGAVAVTANGLDEVATAAFSRGDLRLNRLFINYAGQSQPVPDANPQFDVAKDYTIRRYTETQLNTAMYWSEGSPESIEDFHARGSYYHFNTPKDPSDPSTRVSVYSGFEGGLAAGLTFDNTNLLLFEHYKQAAMITMNNGRVVDVTLVDG
jgi:hypothetical protein